MPDEGTVDAYKNITKLTGPENVRTWMQGIEGFARRKNVTRILNGSYVEPYRRHVPKGHPSYDAVYPEGGHAGDQPPTGMELQDDVEGGELNEEQMAKWEKWEEKENTARAAIIETSAKTLRAFIDEHWSAHEAYVALQEKFKTDTMDHKRSSKHKVTSMRLSEEATPATMRTHYDEFCDNVAESEATGLKWNDFDKCDTFLSTLPYDTQQYVQLMWRSRATLEEATFESLSACYLSVVESRRLQWQQEETVNATGMFASAKEQMNATRAGVKRGGAPALSSRGKKQRNDNDKENAGAKVGKCDYCGKYHPIGPKKCWTELAGLPSVTEAKQKINAIKKAMTEKKANDATSDTHSSDDGHIAAGVTAMALDSKDEGDFEYGVVTHVTGDDAEHIAQVTQTPQELISAIEGDTSTIEFENFLLDSGASVHIVNKLELLNNTRPLSRRFGQAGPGGIFATHVGNLTIALPNDEKVDVSPVYYCPDASLSLLSAYKLLDKGWKVKLEAAGGLVSYNDNKYRIEVKRYTSYMHVRVRRYHSKKDAKQRRKKHTSRTIGVFTVNYDLDTPLFRLHKRLAHLSRSALRRLAREGRVEMSEKEVIDDTFQVEQCWACMQTGFKKLPHKDESPRGTKLAREYVHADLYGKRDPTYDGKQYALVMTADFTKIRHIALLKSKDEAYTEVTNFINLLETQTGATVAVVRTDFGKEFVNQDFKRACERRGIIHQYTGGYMPEHNGVAERVIGTIKARMRAMLASTTLGPAAWGHAMLEAVNVLNMVTPSGVEGQTAWELLTGRTPNLAKIRTFGEFVFVHVPHGKAKSKADVTQPTARAARILGRHYARPGWVVRYEDNGEIGMSADIRTAAGVPIDQPLDHIPEMPPKAGPGRRPLPPRRILIHPSQRSCELKLPLWPWDNMGNSRGPAPSPTPSPSPRATPNPSQAPTRETTREPTAAAGDRGEDSGEPTPGARHEMQDPPTIEIQPPTPPPQPAPAQHQPAAQPEAPAPAEPGVQTRKSPRQPAPRTVPSSYEAATSSTAAEASDNICLLVTEEDSPQLTEELLVAAALEDGETLPEEPKSYAQAMKSPLAEQWEQAWQKEMETLTRKGTWREAKLPPGAKLLGTKEVFRYKFNAEGQVQLLKARCVVRGDWQRPGEHFNETHQPTSRASTLRLLCNLAATYGLELHQADFEAAYLNAKLDMPLYIKFPPGYKQKDPDCDCLELLMGLYGLKQSGHLWWKTAEDMLVSKGFGKVENEWGLYILRKDGHPIMAILLYVDDILAAGRYTAEIEDMFDAFDEKFKLTKLGQASYLLGVRITRDERYIYLSQAAYVDTITQSLPGLCHTVSKYTPMQGPLARTKEGDVKPHKAVVRAYQELLGKLLWLSVMTRPDIAFAASYLGRFCHCPTSYQWEMMMRVVSYLSNTRNIALKAGGDEASLEVYTDSDWGGDPDNRRSTSGCLVKLNGATLNWSSKRQPVVSLSSMEAEYVAASDASRELSWWRELLKEIGLEQEGPTKLHLDNKAAKHLIQRPILHNKSKHIDIRYHYIRKCVELGRIEVTEVASADQLADGFTKPLNGEQTQRFRQALGLVELRGEPAEGSVE